MESLVCITQSVNNGRRLCQTTHSMRPSHHKRHPTKSTVISLEAAVTNSFAYCTHFSTHTIFPVVRLILLSKSWLKYLYILFSFVWWSVKVSTLTAIETSKIQIYITRNCNMANKERFKTLLHIEPWESFYWESL